MQTTFSTDSQMGWESQDVDHASKKFIYGVLMRPLYATVSDQSMRAPLPTTPANQRIITQVR